MHIRHIGEINPQKLFFFYIFGKWRMINHLSIQKTDTDDSTIHQLESLCSMHGSWYCIASN